MARHSNPAAHFALCAVTALSLGASGELFAQSDSTQTLYLFNWTEYLDPETISAFEQEYDARVVQNYFTSNAELFSRLRSGGDAQYDVIVPTDYYVPRLIQAGLIQPLGAIEGREQISPEFLDADYDPEGRYSVPYLWGVTGVVYDPQALPDLPHAWAALFDQAANPEQPFSLLGGDPQVLFGAACAYLGRGFDCTGQQDWVEAGKTIAETMRRPNFQGFTDSTAAIEQVARGVSRAAVTYSGDLDYRREESPETYGRLAFFVPEEGSQRGVDTLAIPAQAPHPELARAFISFMLRPEIAVRNARYAHYYTPNRGAAELLAEQGSSLAPDAATQARLDFVPLLESDQVQLLQQLWNEVRSR